MKKLESYLLEGSKFVVFLMVGMPGSGKSTWVKENYPKLPVISRDIIRAKLGYTKDEEDKAKLTTIQEKRVTEEQYEMIAKCVKKRQSFVIDDTNLSIWRKHLIKTLKDYGATIVGINMDTPLEVCIERRHGQIPRFIMETIYSRMIPIRKEEVDDLYIIKYEEKEDSKN